MGVQTILDASMYVGFGAKGGLQHIRWNAWGGLTAVGDGTWFGYPGTQQEQFVIVRVRLFKRTNCGRLR